MTVTLRPFRIRNSRPGKGIRFSRSGTHGHRMIWLTEFGPISRPPMASWSQPEQFGQAARAKEQT
ncbi:hypothetical protein GCM10010302_62550 [Streptomyces polychromogenes]|uniref:Uncharacterized protein n=1 Tax=Streptomyces polychromogenes TaxID=67342 RepID=A0ABN0VQS2_9ACTN